MAFSQTSVPKTPTGMALNESALRLDGVRGSKC